MHPRAAQLALLLGLSLALPLVAQNQADDAGCALDESVLRPMLADRAAGVEGLTRRRRERHVIVEEATLADQIRLKAVQGGCERYTKRFEFARIDDDAGAGDRRHYFAKASALLRRPIGPSGAPLDAAMAEAFDDAGPKIDGWLDASDGKAWGNCFSVRCSTHFRCDVAVCSLEVRRGSDGLVSMDLSLGFDFPK